MAEFTTKFNLKKPRQEDYYNIEDQNNNMDKIDLILKSHEVGLEQANQQKVQLTDHDERVEYANTDTLENGMHNYTDGMIFSNAHFQARLHGSMCEVRVKVGSKWGGWYIYGRDTTQLLWKGDSADDLYLDFDSSKIPATKDFFLMVNGYFEYLEPDLHGKESRSNGAVLLGFKVNEGMRDYSSYSYVNSTADLPNSGICVMFIPMHMYVYPNIGSTEGRGYTYHIREISLFRTFKQGGESF